MSYQEMGLLSIERHLRLLCDHVQKGTVNPVSDYCPILVWRDIRIGICLYSNRVLPEKKFGRPAEVIVIDTVVRRKLGLGLP